MVKALLRPAALYRDAVLIDLDRVLGKSCPPGLKETKENRLL
jgi:hypothetical protein